MPIDPSTGTWIPRLSPKQLEVYRDNHRYVLSSGPRISGKSRGSLHRIVRHLWEINGARFCIFTKYKKQALGGIWPLMINTIIPEWIKDEVSSEHATIEFTVPPREMGAVRMFYARIRNYWGGESELQLHSLDFDADVEDKIFSTESSGYYFSELQSWKDPCVFSSVLQSLRMEGVAYDDHLWISDTNPPREGPKHFAYKIFFEDRVAPVPEGMNEDEKKEFLAYQNDIALFRYTLDDAVFADPKMIAALKATYRHDPEGWNRFVLGEWTYSRGFQDKHFAQLFRPSVHVIGSIAATDRTQWDMLNPDSTTFELFCGWDLGKVNHAMAIAQKRLTEDGKTRWEFIDELVSLAEKVRIEEFTEGVIEKREALEKLIGHSVHWRDWTDTSAFDFSRGGLDEIDAETVERVSHGKIRFIPATAAKRPGSIRKRVEKIRELLAQDRILVSAHCTHIIEMFKELRKGATELAFVLRGQPQKHIFDAVSYLIYSEMLEDLEEDNALGAVEGPRLLSMSPG